METISRSLLTFLLNSLWQIPLAALVAALACRMLRRGPASHRHAVWVAALIAAVLLPVASVRPGQPTPGPQFAASLADGAVGNLAVGRPAQAPRAPTPAARTVSFAETTASALLGAYLLFVLFRFARLGWASMRTMQIRNTGPAGACTMRPAIRDVTCAAAEAAAASPAMRDQARSATATPAHPPNSPSSGIMAAPGPWRARCSSRARA